MESQCINTLFVKSIRELGVPIEDQKRYISIFDTPKKIQTIVSLYTLQERRSKILECLNELKTRHSLVYLLFLRFTIETISFNDEMKMEVWNYFLRNDGLSVLQTGYKSKSGYFINQLIEFTIFICREYKCCNNMLDKMLNRYDFAEKSLIYTYLNMKIDRSALYLDYRTMGSVKNNCCYCFMFIKRISDDILELKQIKEEFLFLLEENIPLKSIFSENFLKSREEKFLNKEMYKKLLDRLNSSDLKQRTALLPSLNQNDAIKKTINTTQTEKCDKVSDRYLKNDNEKKYSKVQLLASSSFDLTNNKTINIKSSNEDFIKLQSRFDELQQEYRILKTENIKLKLAYNENSTKKTEEV